MSWDIFRFYLRFTFCFGSLIVPYVLEHIFGLTQRPNKIATLRKHSYRHFFLMDSQFLYDQNKVLEKRK